LRRSVVLFRILSDLGAVVSEMPLPCKVGVDLSLRQIEASRWKRVVERVADGNWKSGGDVEK